jgi:UDP-N-acetylmuramate--alanine ligase
VHFIAIGGAGMSGVARLLMARGVPVTGSDARTRQSCVPLPPREARVWIGHDAASPRGRDTVVVSSAIREDNPELAAARARKAADPASVQALAATMPTHRCGIAVAGANGKTTTTSLLPPPSPPRRTPRSPSGGSWSVADRGMGNARLARRLALRRSRPTRATAAFLVYHPHVAVDHQRAAGPPRLLRHLRQRPRRPMRAFAATVPPDGLARGLRR